MGSLTAPALAAAAIVVLGASIARRTHPVRRPDLVGDDRPRPRQRTRLRVARRRAAHGLDPSAVAAWCDDAARALRAGSALSAAIADTSSAYPAMAAVTDPVLAATTRGRSLVESLRAACGDPSSPAGLALAVLHSCAELGGPAASPLERVAATLRTRAAILEELQAHSAQARLSARVLTLVPVALLALLVATEDRVRAAVLTPPGLAAITLGGCLNAVGWWWMRRIIGVPR